MKANEKTILCLREALAKLERALDTPYDQWREKSPCREMLMAYDTGSSKVGKMIAEVLYGSAVRGIKEWGRRPFRYSEPDDLEDLIKDRIKDTLSADLPLALEEWLVGMNERTRDVVNSYLAVELMQKGCDPCEIPCLYMGDYQLYMAKEISYDVLIGLWDRVDSFYLDNWMRTEKIPRLFQFFTRHRMLRLYLPGLEDLLEEDRFEFEIDIGGYFLCKDFLDAYRSCVLENLQDWIDQMEQTDFSDLCTERETC